MGQEEREELEDLVFKQSLHKLERERDWLVGVDMTTSAIALFGSEMLLFALDELERRVGRDLSHEPICLRFFAGGGTYPVQILSFLVPPTRGEQ